ncbi:MAG: hypothetical protein JXR51_16520 [Bacteroidales bacterium]|nr:hypothetical protein [Bacteroidales bacterium]MBN2758772.1 hypothetical protein [Bacteroidales bacterium]
MKKKFIYIVLFFSGLFLGMFVLSNNTLINFFKNSDKVNQQDYFASEYPWVEKKLDFINSAASMIGKEIIVSGIVEEGYKNKSDELVIFIKDENLPFDVFCTLIKSDEQILKPLRIGENMLLKGTFTKLDENIYIENCTIIKRMKVIDN